MTKRKYTLPRHTNLANQGPRIGAFLIDLAITLALSLAFIFGCFRFVFNFKTEPLEARIEEERIKSELFFKNDKDELIYWTQDDVERNEEFKNALAYFYTVYIPLVQEDKDKPVTVDGVEKSKKEYFTVEWFNSNILDIEGDGRAYFEYVKVGEEDDKSQLAKIKEDAFKENVNSFLQHAWIKANSDLNKLESFKKLNNQFGFYNALEFVLSSLIATSIVYLLLPLVLKNGVTLGKKVFGLCLADMDGYKIKNFQVFMRIIPVFAVILTTLIPIWNSLIIALIAFILLGLVSFTFVMASPKKCALHDFAARTIVVNAKTSTLFDNPAEEEEFISKEDNIPLDAEDYGEEPTIKYER